MPAGFTATDFSYLLPEFVLTAAALVVLLMDAFAPRARRAALGWLTIAGIVATTVCVFLVADVHGTAGRGLVAIDGFASFFKLIFLLAAALTVLMSMRFVEVEGMRPGPYYFLILCATLGMMFMASGIDLITLFIGLETMAISFYILTGLLKPNRRSNEAAIKYFLLGTFSLGLLLYGMSLLYGLSGSTNLRTIATALAGHEKDVWLMLAVILVVAGMGFKIAAVPFHMWAPDVYEGAPAPVTALIATVSKGGMFALMLRLFTQIGFRADNELFWLFTAVAIASMFAGNLLALMQNNVKRILAYSSIAHLGYLLTAFLASGSLAVTAVTFYFIAYFVASVGSFGVMTVLSGPERDADQIEDYRGLFWTRPWLAGVFTVMLLSMAGMPLTAGFVGKFYLVAAGAQASLWALVMILVATSVIGLFYYLRIIVAMYSQPSEEERAASFPSLPSPSETVVLAMATSLSVWLGVYPAPLIHIIPSLIR